jgi:Flp pilus assembly protein TadG
MTENARSAEKGQTLVIVALVLTVLMLMAGLAIDVGTAYNTRRDLQTAADAGALAGAQRLCDGSTQDNAKGVAEQIATMNAVAGMYISVTAVATPTVTTSARSVQVRVSAQAETFFMRLPPVSVESIPVAADATARCSCSAAAGGLWPIAFDWPQWNATGCESPSHFIIWDSMNGIDAALSGGQDICSKCDCSPLQAYTTLLVAQVMSYGPMGLQPGSRGWLNLVTPANWTLNPACTGNSCSSCGSALDYWLRNDYPQLLEVGGCVPTQDGTNTNALAAALTREGDVVGLVLFDLDQGCTGTLPCGPSNPSQGRWLRVKETGCMKINKVFTGTGSNKLTLDDLPIAGTPVPVNEQVCPKNVGAIFVTKQCNCPWSGQGMGGGLYNSTCVPAVSLSE